MKLTAAERIAVCVTFALLIFTVGFFVGRTTVSGSVVVEAAAPEASAYQQPVSEDAAEVSPEESDVLTTAAAADGSGSTAASAPDSSLWTPDCGELLDLNLAVQEELENLPGIGPVLAERILAYRSSVGSFRSLEELKNVDGIGDKIYSTISEYLKVEDHDEDSGSR